MTILSPGISSASSTTAEGDEARAALATAERYSLEGNPGLALPNAERAMMGIPVKPRPRLDPRAGTSR